VNQRREKERKIGEAIRDRVRQITESQYAYLDERFGTEFLRLTK